MFKPDRFLELPVQPGMLGNGLFGIRNFDPIHKRFQPECLVRSFAGNGIAVCLELNQSRFVSFHRNNPATLRGMGRQRQEMGFLAFQASANRFRLSRLGMV